MINEEEKYKIYYFIDGKVLDYQASDRLLIQNLLETHRPEDYEFFELDKETRRLTLVKDLDRETVDHHQIRILATNLETYPTRRVAENSLLIVDISVNDVNDNPPKFQYDAYSVGVSELDNEGKVLLTLSAFDPDLNDVVSFRLLTDTIIAAGTNLEEIKATAFRVNNVSGALTLHFRLQSSMRGYFEFKVEARDLADHTDETTIKIYLVAEANRVTFTFLNDLDFVQSVDSKVLAEIFGLAYSAECVIDEMIRTVNSDGVVQVGLTDVRVHFIRNSEALEKSVILESV